LKNEGNNQQIGHIIIFFHFSFNDTNLTFQTLSYNDYLEGL